MVAKFVFIAFICVWADEVTSKYEAFDNLFCLPSNCDVKLLEISKYWVFPILLNWVPDK